MKRRFFIGSIFLAFSFLSCQKGLDYSIDNGGNIDSTGTGGDTTGGDPQYYMKFQANGVQKEYSEETSAFFSTLNSLYTCDLIGEASATNGTEGMGISIYNEAPIDVNVTYNDGGLPTLGIPQTTVIYTDSSGTQFTSITPLNADVKVIFTEITSTYVKGTFSCNLESLDGSASITVTEGSFVLPRS